MMMKENTRAKCPLCSFGLDWIGFLLFFVCLTAFVNKIDEEYVGHTQHFHLIFLMTAIAELGLGGKGNFSIERAN